MAFVFVRTLGTALSVDLVFANSVLASVGSPTELFVGLFAPHKPSSAGKRAMNGPTRSSRG